MFHVVISHHQSVYWGYVIVKCLCLCVCGKAASVSVCTECLRTQHVRCRLTTWLLCLLQLSLATPLLSLACSILWHRPTYSNRYTHTHTHTLSITQSLTHTLSLSVHSPVTTVRLFDAVLTILTLSTVWVFCTVALTAKSESESEFTLLSSKCKLQLHITVYLCMCVYKVMKKLMSVPLEFWLRFVNVDHEDDDPHSTVPAQPQGAHMFIIMTRTTDLIDWLRFNVPLNTL